MDDTVIPDEVRKSVEYRRGSLATMERLDLARTALLVMDVQNFYWNKDLPVAYAPDMANIVDKVNAIAALCRQLSVPVFWIQHMFTEGWTSWYEKTTKGEVARALIENTTPGSRGFEIHDSMDVQPGDQRVLKTRYSAMLHNSSDLDLQLLARRVDTLIITGGLTNCCCESTARDAMMMDYDVVFVSDANASRSEAQHQASLVSLAQLFADVRDTASLMEMMKLSAESYAPELEG
ncbi:cysteine hydrolase family protein [Fodinicurvata fenggangensis]|uniref:cysteine hydrolase family protein n=1 Tax=Fodinicurvata fenggangensis TaxID=1121830 RepID=UPI00068F6E24|nr:cysteine hydrolase [Fodinicurvata fenggangensis]